MLNSATCPMTTGDCCVAAARAAAANLIFKINTETVSINHEGKIVTIPVVRQDEGCDKNGSEYMAEMSGGTPPDIKEKAKIFVKVSRIDDFANLSNKAFIDIRYGNLFMQAGEGIGTASGDKAGIKIGEALIEADVRKMIFEAVADVCEISDGAQLLLITVRCPDGMLIAAKQSMGQNAFAGGITIIGNRGKITKIHQREITNSIDNQIGKFIRAGAKSVLVAPGDYCSERIEQQLHISLDSAIFCYNYPGYAIDTCFEKGIENLLLVGNIGKLVKLAAGISNTNSFASDGRREIFAAHTAVVGGTSAQVRTVMNCSTCDEILYYLDTCGLKDRVMASIMKTIDEYVKARIAGNMKIAIALFSKQFGLLGSTSETKNVLVKVSQEQFALSHKLK